jgi:hypothetical protein
VEGEKAFSREGMGKGKSPAAVEGRGKGIWRLTLGAAECPRLTLHMSMLAGEQKDRKIEGNC